MTEQDQLDAINHYHELLAGEMLARTQEILARVTEEQKLAFGDRPVCTVLRPYFIDTLTYTFVQRTSTLVMRGIAALSRRLNSDPQLRRELDLTHDEEETVHIETRYGPPDVSARLDGFLSPERSFNFVEYNAESPGGLAYGDALSDAFSSMPIMRAFSSRHKFRAFPIRATVFDALLGAYHGWGRQGLPSLP